MMSSKNPVFITLQELFEIVENTFECDPETQWVVTEAMHPEDLIAQVRPVLSTVSGMGSFLARKVAKQRIFSPDVAQYDWMSVDRYGVEGRPE
jgi:hypothetical protein